MWRREDVHLDDEFVLGDGGTIYRVVAIMDQPVVVLRHASHRPERGMAMGGAQDIHQVISSPAFADWRKVRRLGPGQ